jgi:hypothetical protein
LTSAYNEAERVAKAAGKGSALDDLSAANRAFVEQSARNKELSYDPAHKGWTNQSVSEAKAMLDGEARGLVDSPVTRNLENTSDFTTPKGEVDHYGPRNLDPNADVEALVGKLENKTYDVYLDASAIDAATEGSLIAATRARLAADGKPGLIAKVISSRTGRLAP